MTGNVSPSGESARAGPAPAPYVAAQCGSVLRLRPTHTARHAPLQAFAGVRAVVRAGSGLFGAPEVIGRP